MVDRDVAAPAYQRIADELRAKIAAGDHPPGTALPSERQLAETYEVTRPTVRHALQLLRAAGVVTASPGRGVYVKAPTEVVRLARNRLSRAARAENKGAFLGDAAAAGFTPSSSVRVYFEAADDATAEALGVEPGTEVTVRDRTMRADGAVVQLAVSRLPRELTRGTAAENVDTGPGGLYARLEDAGHALARFVETVSARQPTADEARTLQASGAPVITVQRIAYDTDGRAVEVNDMTMAADRYALVYDLPAD